MLTVDQFVGHSGGAVNNGNRIAKFVEKRHIASDFSEKSESSLHKRRSLRNCEKGTEFLTCDGCEDEYNK